MSDLITYSQGKAVSRPVEIEWMLYDGSFESAQLLGAWSSGAVSWYDIIGMVTHLFVDTLEGRMQARPGDYIIRGTKGEYYPCKPDVFEAKYEVVK